ncbi:MAG: hypothetical protein ABI833_00920 [Acidobacteriota bacterium]
MPCSAADFLTGQAARAVIGQTFFSAQATGASNNVIGAAGGLAFANNTLFVADDNHIGLLPDNNRVLIFSNMQQFLRKFDAEIPPYSGRCPVCVGQASGVVGQPDFTSTAGGTSTLVANPTPITASSMFQPTAVASDGNILAVADTSNNRVLIWKSIPTTFGQPADLVLGQPNFTSVAPVIVTASSLRAPQGVWIQNGKLFVADTEDNRILIWNSIPTQNNQAADVVLGQPNFTTSPQVNQVNLALPTSANIMLSPTSVTSDGTRLYVADLGYNRVLIWNSIPTTNQKPADVEIGQKDMSQSISNDAMNLCTSNGTDSNGNAAYPARCGKTLSFPRYALAGGGRLFIADGGNDRVLVYNTIPTQNAAAADVVLGEPDEFSDIFTNSNPVVLSSSDITPTPTSLAWDPVNQDLYVADATDYRVLVFSPATSNVPIDGVVNAASLAVFAQGTVVIGGAITAGNVITITITGATASTGAKYTYTVKATDTLEDVALGVTAAINARNGDPDVLAIEVATLATVNLIARKPGPEGNSIAIASSTPQSASITAIASGASLRGGGSSGIIAPGSVILYRGTNLADTTASASPTSVLPFELAGVQLYIDGERAPLFSVSPTEIKAQFPFAIIGADSATSWVRTTHDDGSVTVTTAVNIQVEDQNPGIFADPSPGAQDPRAVMATHGSSFATGTVSVDGAIQAGDVGTLSVGGANYNYTVLATDTLASVRDGFVSLINANLGSPVVAYPAGVFTRIRLQSKIPGPDGDGTPISTDVTTPTTNTGGAQLLLTATNSALCCANAAGTLITPANPAIPGETINIFTTGLGLVCSSPIMNAIDFQLNFIGFCTASPDAALSAIVDGAPYNGPPVNAPIGSVSSLVGGSSAQVIFASLMVGQVGLYQITLELSPSVTPNPQTQMTISQGINTSNVVTIPIGLPPQQ